MADIGAINRGVNATYAQIILVVGAITYVARAIPGSSHTAAVWQAYQAEEVDANTTVIKWADGDAKFDNTPGADGAGLAALSYS